jgi:DnaK suppressor protein
MARKDALLRLHKTLLERRNELMKRLGVEIRDLGHNRLSVPSGDSADAAFDSGSNEISSQLAELEARELAQVQRAISRLKQGTYGTCEVCHTKIPVARLNALPFSTMCISCQREMENSSEHGGAYGDADWDRVADTEHRFSDRREVDISDIEIDLSK